MKTRVKKVLIVNISLLLILLIYYKFYTITNIGIPCIFKIITGYKCPGCGITRCIFSLIKLDIKGAFSYNQLVTILIVPFIIYYIYLNYCYIFNKDNKFKSIVNKLSLILIFISIIFGIVRNF